MKQRLDIQLEDLLIDNLQWYASDDQTLIIGSGHRDLFKVFLIPHDGSILFTITRLLEKEFVVDVVQHSEGNSGKEFCLIFKNENWSSHNVFKEIFDKCSFVDNLDEILSERMKEKTCDS